MKGIDKVHEWQKVILVAWCNAKNVVDISKEDDGFRSLVYIQELLLDETDGDTRIYWTKSGTHLDAF